MVIKLLLFTATAGSGAALAPHTWRRGAGRTRDSAATPQRRHRVTRRVLDDEAIGLDLEALGDLGALDDAASLDLDALVAGAGLTVASTAALADAGGAVPALAADLSAGPAATLGAEELLAFERDGHICTRGLFSSDEISAMHDSLEAVSRVEATAAERHAVAMNDAMGGERAPFLQTFNPHRRHRPALMVATCARLAATARALLGVEEVQLYQSCLFKKRAGDEATNWHSDLHTSPLDTNDFVTCWFPLHDLEADSTGLCYATGSHRDLALPMWYGQGFDADGRYELEDHGAYQAGDVSWHHGWLLHSAADNRSPRDRLAVAVSFFGSGARVIEEDGLACVNDEDHPSYDDWLPDLAPGDVAAHELLPVVR